MVGETIKSLAAPSRPVLRDCFRAPRHDSGWLGDRLFLDSYLGTSPWFLIAVTAIAFAGAFVRLVQWVKVFARERDGSGSEKDDTAN